MQEHSNTEQIQFSSLIVVSFVLLFMKISGIIQKHKYKYCLIFLSNIDPGYIYLLMNIKESYLNHNAVLIFNPRYQISTFFKLTYQSKRIKYRDNTIMVHKQ